MRKFLYAGFHQLNADFVIHDAPNCNHVVASKGNHSFSNLAASPNRSCAQKSSLFLTFCAQLVYCFKRVIYMEHTISQPFDAL